MVIGSNKSFFFKITINYVNNYKKKKILCNISTLPILSVAKIKWRLLTLMMDANYSVTVWGSKRFNVNRSCVSSQLTSLTMTNFWVTIIITPFLYLSLTIRHVNWYQILFAKFFSFLFVSLNFLTIKAP